MLKDEAWSPVSVHRVVADFIEGEPHHWRERLPAELHHVVESPDLDAGRENALRWRLLHSYRRHLMGEIPPDTEWFEVTHLQDAHLDELLVIARCDFFDGPPFELRKVGEHKAIELESPPDTWSPPILWAHGQDGPFTIIEGNHRLAAYAHNPTGSLRITAHVGLSPTPCYWHAPDPPQKLLHDLWS